MAHDCTHDAVAACQHENGHGEDGHHDESPASTLIIGVDVDSDHRHDHSACNDDRCQIIRVVTPVFNSAVFLVEYLGGIESISVPDAATYSGSTYDPFPDCPLAATGVRSHLLLGVLTL